MNAIPSRPALLSVVGFVCLLTACSRLPFNEVAVVERNFDDEVQRTQNLTFTFNKNVGSATRIDASDSTQYVRFKPAVRSKFK